MSQCDIRLLACPCHARRVPEKSLTTDDVTS